ncbi:LPXTG cell wall anchor domain-containing protein [Enterococcus termitis]
MVQEIQQFIPVKINDPANSVKDRIGIRLEPLENEIVGMVGESGHLTLGEFEGIKLEGVFTEIKDNPYIEISSNGTWKALTAGEDAIYVGVELSDKTVKDIKEKYPDREIIYPELLPKKIKVSIKNLTTQTNQNAGVQTSNKGSSTKTGELPKTGESQSQFVFQIWGLNLLAIYTFTTLFKKIF